MRDPISKAEKTVNEYLSVIHRNNQYLFTIRRNREKEKEYMADIQASFNGIKRSLKVMYMAVFIATVVLVLAAWVGLFLLV